MLTALAAVLLLHPVLPALAAELPEETILPAESTVTEPPVETTAPPETTLPPETETTVPETTEAEETFPDETAPPETTLPQETVPPTEETTMPTEAAQPEPVPEETAAVEETITATMPAAEAVMFTTISQAKAMPAGTMDLHIRGTVVFTMGLQAVLQDRTGGIRMTFSEEPGIVLGDVLEVTGNRSGGFAVTAFETVDTAELPALETTLLEAPDTVRVWIREAVLENGALNQGGFSMRLAANLPDSAEGMTVDAWGVILDGVFYADSVVPVETQEESPAGGWNLYFGLLHAHTDISDGLGTVEEAFAHAYEREDLDFFAVTDHSEAFDNAAGGAIDRDGTAISPEWAAGKAAAAAVTDGSFVGLFGYEMSWPEGQALGHINTFNTPGWESWDQGTPDDRTDDQFKTLTDYYEVLATVPGSISQFNHPGHTFGNFRSFLDYSPIYDEQIHLLEVGSGDNGTAYEAYTKALDEGWHVAPTNNQSNHNGQWGDASPVRTVIVAQELTEASLYDAMRNHRVYATEDADLEILYQVNSQPMGTILGPQEALAAVISLSDPTDTALGTVEVIVDKGKSILTQWVAEPAAELTLSLPLGYSYYYLRITQPDGDTAVTAPVWVDNYENIGIRSFEADEDQPMQEQEVQLTLELFNEENTEFVLEKLEFSWKTTEDPDETTFHEEKEPGTVQSLNRLSYTLPFSWDQPGEVVVTAKVTGTAAGLRRAYEESLSLRFQAKETPLYTITEVRTAHCGGAFRLQGYVTAGNDNPHNTFPDTLYLQDDTGGIAVTGISAVGIEVGQPMEVTGVLRQDQDGNLYLEQTDYLLISDTLYRYVPRTMTHAVAMDYAAHGGELLQVQGTVMSVEANGKAVSRFTLKDVRGDLATVIIEEGITSGANGKNELASQIKKGRTVRAMGLLHVDEYGETVLRVRNCDEVVYVPPKADPTNPKTGDRFFFLQ